ncbi:MAG: helix-turn-helix domain-containing protein [Mycobacteriales bacterium]
MTRSSPYVIELSDADGAVLEARTRASTDPYRAVFRAQIVLLATEGWENVAIGAELGTGANVVSRWRKRYFEEGLDGLKDRKRAGRRPVFSPLGEGRGGGAGLRAADPGAAGLPGAPGVDRGKGAP